MSKQSIRAILSWLTRDMRTQHYIFRVMVSKLNFTFILTLYIVAKGLYFTYYVPGDPWTLPVH